jgi:hypothetical protein
MTADFFAEPGPTVVDGMLWNEQGRPMITPPGGTEPIAYRRASAIPRIVDNLYWLLKWKTQMVALGVARSPELVEQLAAMEYGHPDLRDLTEQAHIAAGGNVKAQWGTDIHLYTEPDADLTDLPGEMVPDVTAYHCALERAGIAVLDTEVRVVNDELGIAGRLDHLYDVPGYGVCVIDKKTGTFAPLSAAVQVGIYANSQRYIPDPDDPTHGRREPLWESLNLDWGMVARIPNRGGSCTITPLNIARGYRVARIAMTLLPHQEAPASEWIAPDVIKVTRRDCLTARIAAAPDRATLEQLWRDTPKAVWTKAHDTAAKARIAALAGAAA